MPHTKLNGTSLLLLINRYPGIPHLPASGRVAQVVASVLHVELPKEETRQVYLEFVRLLTVV